jgi:probable rRNA maturation factor
MEIQLINQSSDESVMGYEADYHAIADKTLKTIGKERPYEMSVIFVDPEQIHEINRDYRGIDRATDVISFAIQDGVDAFENELEENELGDIFINVQAIIDQAKEYGHSARREACFLFCHGLLHLLGYDHMKEEEEKVMFSLQDEILDELVKR